MATRARLAIVPALGLAALVLLGPAPAAALKTEAVFDVGHTFAVQGEPDNGGVSLGLSFLWPIEERFRIGLMGFGDELGNAVERLTGPGGEDLGPAAAGTRYTWGGALRFEGHLRSAHRANPFALLTWGISRVQDDLLGASVNTDYAASLGLGVGAVHTINPQHALGLVVRGQMLTHGEAQRYLSAALEWRWHWEGGPAEPATGTTK